MADAARILVVDDNEAVRFFLREELALAGYVVLTAASGEEALARLQEETVDLVLLDLKMGGIDGLAVLEEVERQECPPAVIILTAHASMGSAIAALRLRALDYLLKPCPPEKLLHSVARGLARRAEDVQGQRGSPSAPSALSPRFQEARGLLLDRRLRQVTRQGQALQLTSTEFSLLSYLMEHPDHPCSMAELARALHGLDEDEPAARQALSSHLWRLRRKLGAGPDGRPYIVNVRGQGYTLVKGPGEL